MSSFPERPVHARRRIERGVHLLQRHAVGQQRELQVVARHAPHAAPAREALQVEEVLDRGRPGVREVLRMVRIDGGEEDGPHPAVGERSGDEVLLRGGAVRRRREVLDGDELQQTLVTAQHGVGHVQVDHVPVHVAGLNLRADLREPAVVVLQLHLDPGGLRERLVIRLLARTRIRPAEGHDGQRLLGRSRHAEEKQGEQHGARQSTPPGQTSCSHPPIIALPYPERSSVPRHNSLLDMRHMAHYVPS